MTPGRNPGAAGTGQADEARGDPDRGSSPATPLLEWIVGGLGLVLVGSAIAFLLYHSLMRDRTPPDIRLVVERVLDVGHRHLVQFRAFNQGRSAAAQVTIEGELVGPDGTTEVSETVLDYLPPRSGREGGLFFSQDPRRGQLGLRAKGYVAP